MRWVPIPGFDGYEISETSEVRSNRAGRKMRPVKPRLAPTGYIRYGLMRNGQQVWRFAHRLLWEAFVGPISDGLVINHKNGVKDDNRLENLEVVTISQNTKHAYRVLGVPPVRNPSPGERNGLAKLSEEQVEAMRRKRISEGWSYQAIGDAFGVNKSTAHRVCTGRAWRHI